MPSLVEVTLVAEVGCVLVAATWTNPKTSNRRTDFNHQLMRSRPTPGRGHANKPSLWPNLASWVIAGSPQDAVQVFPSDIS